MLHTILTLDRPLIVFDTETTGTSIASDRIVELGFQVWTPAGLDKEWRHLINPGVPIPPAATKVHGITDADVTGCRTCRLQPGAHPSPECTEFVPPFTFKQLAANLAKGFSHCDFAGMNVRFDLRILAAEMQRAGVAWSPAGARVIDASRLEQLAVPRSLSHLYEKYTGEKHAGAHGALSDVRATTQVIVQQLQQHDVLKVGSVAQLHSMSWPNDIDSDGKFKFNADGVPVVTFGKWRDRPMAEVDPSYWDWILREESFSAEAKQIAAEAKLKQFPVRA